MSEAICYLTTVVQIEYYISIDALWQVLANMWLYHAGFAHSTHDISHFALLRWTRGSPDPVGYDCI